MVLIEKCTGKLKEILAGIHAQQTKGGLNSDMIKTAYFFLETLFSQQNENICSRVHSETIQGFFQIIQQIFESLN